jgi:hypothetical protein
MSKFKYLLQKADEKITKIKAIINEEALIVTIVRFNQLCSIK